MHKAPMGEKNEARLPHLVQSNVSLLLRPTDCINNSIGIWRLES